MKKKTPIHKRASQLIYSAHNPLLVCHVAPDGDAIGSMTALARVLLQMGRKPIAACSDSISSRFDFIPGVEAIVQEVNDSFDLVISLDCSDMKRMGHFVDMPTFGSQPLLNIDHHVTNVHFGDVNFVDAQASSTAEVVLGLLEHMDVPLDADIATSLLIGIVTDTRGFRTSNVTVPVMEAALHLMQAGASLSYITQHGLERRSIEAMRLWGAALGRMRIVDGLIWASLPLEMRRAVGYAGSGDAGLASFLLSAEAADISVVFVERDDGRVEVGMRAVPGFDVAQVALHFGGGGHSLAAGFNIAGPLEKAQEQVLAILRDDLTRQRSNRGV